MKKTELEHRLGARLSRGISVRSNTVSLLARPGSGCLAAATLLGIALAIQVRCLGADELPYQRALLLTWAATNAEEQIVVSANSLTSSVWTPCAEPIYQRLGQVCVSVPATRTEQYFQLAPGTHYLDHFSDPKEPFTGRDPYVLGFFASADSTCWDAAVSNGVLRILMLTQPADKNGRLMIRPPGPLVEVKDYVVSVDLLSYDTTRIPEAKLGIGARIGGDPGHFPGNNNGYFGALAPHADGPNLARLNFWTGNSIINGEKFDYKPGTPYRLIFSGVGTRFSVELIDLSSNAAAVEPLVLTNSVYQAGLVCMFTRTGPGQMSCDASLDNFFVTGTKP